MNVYLCLLVCVLLHWLQAPPWCSWIFAKYPSHLSLNSFFAHHVHWCFWINYEFSLIWSFRSGCRHYPRFNRCIKRSFVRILELVNIFRQIPCYSAGASFLVQGLLMLSFPELWRAKTTPHEVHTFGLFLAMDPFFPDFLFDARCPWRIWRRVLIPIFFFHGDTQPNSVDSPPFFDFLLGFSSASTCRNRLSSPQVPPDSDL